jgi:signal transduction histidine kinase
MLLFIGATVVLVVTFGWIGRRLLQHEEAIATQQIQQRLDAAADLASAALLRHTAELAGQLTALSAASPADLQAAARRLGARLGPDARVVIIEEGRVETFPEGGLPYYPPQPTEDLGDAVFAVADSYEFAQRDPARAVRVLRPLAADDDARVRAGAWLRLGRNLQKLTERAGALAAYEQLAALGATRVGGLPAELVARYARAAVFEKLQDETRLQEEARALDAELRQGRWRIDRPTYVFYSAAAQRWLQRPDPTLDEQPALLAAAVEQLWTDWPQIQRGAGEPAGARMVGDGENALVLMWQSAPARLAGIVASAPHIEREWIGPIRSAAERQRVAIELVTAASRATPPVARAGVVRTASETGLPWTLRAASADPAGEAAELAARRGMIIGGLALVGCVLLMSTYAIGRAMTRELEAARLRSDFVAAVSHEFRSPLTAMRQVAELLASGRVANDERRDAYYVLLMRETQRLGRLVENLLDFGRSEAGSAEPRRESVDLAALARETIAEFRHDALQRGYDITVSGADEVVMVSGDRDALGRALWNLLDNAVKYSPECQTIWVSISREADRAAIAVRDRGVGIPAAERDAIFGKFIRGAAARSTGAKGTGLGLALVRHIVDDHGGDIRLTSEQGAGSTFTITLPEARS